MAIELQEGKIKKNYFAYIFIALILIAIFYFLVSKILKEKSLELAITAPAVDITKGLSEIKKEEAGIIFALPIFKTLAKYVPASVDAEQLGRLNPFAAVSVSTSTPTSTPR